MGSQSVCTCVRACTFMVDIYNRDFSLTFLCFCTCSSIVVFGFCRVSVHLRSICDQASCSRVWFSWFSLCGRVCVFVCHFYSSISIRIDLQQAFSLIWRCISYEDLKMEAQNVLGSQRARFLATCSFQYGKLTILWSGSQNVCVCECILGGKAFRSGEREEGRKGLRKGERELMKE